VVRRVSSDVIVEYGHIHERGGCARADDDGADNFIVLAGAKIDGQFLSRRNDERRVELNEFAEVGARQTDEFSARGLRNGLPQVRFAGDRRIGQVGDCDRADLTASPIVMSLEHVDPACGIDDRIWLKCQFPLRNATG
jgi:hypothetical protein